MALDKKVIRMINRSVLKFCFTCQVGWRVDLVKRVLRHPEEVEKFLDNLEAPDHRRMVFNFGTNTITLQGERKPFVGLDPVTFRIIHILYHVYVERLWQGQKQPEPMSSKKLGELAARPHQRSSNKKANIMHKKSFQRKLDHLEEEHKALRDCIVPSGRGPNSGYVLNLSWPQV